MANVHSDLLATIAGIGGVLIFASLIGWVLQRRYSPNGENAVVENLNDRTRNIIKLYEEDEKRSYVKG